jgi:Sulfatase
VVEVYVLKTGLNTLLRLVSGAYFVVTSLYCLLAYLPYTYTAFIKTPPYAWMPWFAHHQAALFWLAAAMAIIGNWGMASPDDRRIRDPRFGESRFIAGCGVLAVCGMYLTARPFVPTLQSDRAAFWWSMAGLLPIVGLALWRQHAATGHRIDHDEGSRRPFGYSTGVVVALVTSVIYTVSARAQIYSETFVGRFRARELEVALWSMVSHAALAIAVFSALNLVVLVSAKTPQPRATRRWMLGGLITIVLTFLLARFLDDAMSFDGWRAWSYSGALALAITVWGFWLLDPLFTGHADASRSALRKISASRTILIWAVMAALAALALGSHSLIGGEDWNGFVENTSALIFWIAMSLCVYRLRPVRADYSVVSILGILLVSGFVYKGLQATEIFWCRPMGSTDDEISLILETYGAHDASFLLAHHALGNSRHQVCGDLCRILRENTNIRDTHISAGVRLVDNMKPTQGDRPNIFLFVIDSMRPDYLGPYNPQRVNYTPNLDALARDSIVFKNAATQYMGTSLSEPAIWSGSLLLHTHFPEPFDEVNSLRTLAKTDGYQMVVSYDVMLQQIISPSDVTKLDSKIALWNQYEICSTVQQLESTLDGSSGTKQPVFFYAQSMNVHQFARNNLPSAASQHWHGPEGLNQRITYEVHGVDTCLGGFFGYLKQRGLYDNSIIVIASDHGDATGEFGRSSHSISIWPEILHVPLIMHIPPKMREHLVYDENRLSTLTDIAPTLYYLLGHRPIRQNPLYGRPLFAETKQELDQYRRKDLLLASDVRAVYGILTADERYLYATYDSPAQSYLFDLQKDPNAEHSILSAQLKQHYDDEIIEQLHVIGDYYGFKPSVGSLLASRR